MGDIDWASYAKGVELLFIGGLLFWFYRNQMRAVRTPTPDETKEPTAKQTADDDSAR